MTGKDLAANSGYKSARMAKLWEFLQGHPEPSFSEKVQRGDQGKFFKNRPKRCPRLKGPKALWRKCLYPLNSMRLKCKDWRRFRRKQRLQKCPNGQVTTIFARSPKSRIFWKSTSGGPREIFQTSPIKMPSLKRPKRTLAQMALSSNQYALEVERLDNILAHKAAPKVPEWPGYGNFRQVTQTCIFWKSAKSGPREFIQKLPKR